MTPAALPWERGYLEELFLQHPSVGDEDPLQRHMILLLFKCLIFSWKNTII